MTRELWETVVDLVSALDVPQLGQLGLYLTQARLELPVEVSVIQTAIGFQLAVGAPQFRWSEGIQRRSGRLRVEVGESADESL
jgi:hypothetical protein